MPPYPSAYCCRGALIMIYRLDPAGPHRQSLDRRSDFGEYLGIAARFAAPLAGWRACNSVNSSAVMSFLSDQRGVTDVHDLHIWALSTTSVALTAHLVVPDRGAEDALLDSVTPNLKRRFHIHHATLQIERDRCEHGCETDAETEAEA